MKWLVTYSWCSPGSRRSRSSASVTMVRSLKIRNGRPAEPTLTWRKNAGPGDVAFTNSPRSRITGAVTTSMVVARTMSRPRRTTSAHRAG